jgi:hypothetical protein
MAVSKELTKYKLGFVGVQGVRWDGGVTATMMLPHHNIHKDVS